jgi:hypothetical protein
MSRVRLRANPKGFSESRMARMRGNLGSHGGGFGLRAGATYSAICEPTRQPRPGHGASTAAWSRAGGHGTQRADSDDPRRRAATERATTATATDRRSRDPDERERNHTEIEAQIVPAPRAGHTKGYQPEVKTHRSHVLPVRRSCSPGAGRMSTTSNRLAPPTRTNDEVRDHGVGQKEDGTTQESSLTPAKRRLSSCAANRHTSAVSARVRLSSRVACNVYAIDQHARHAGRVGKDVRRRLQRVADLEEAAGRQDPGDDPQLRRPCHGRSRYHDESFRDMARIRYVTEARGCLSPGTHPRRLSSLVTSLVLQSGAAWTLFVATNLSGQPSPCHHLIQVSCPARNLGF